MEPGGAIRPAYFILRKSGLPVKYINKNIDKNSQTILKSFSKKISKTYKKSLTPIPLYDIM